MARHEETEPRGGDDPAGGSGATGPEGRFLALYGDHYRPVYAYVYRRLPAGSPDVADLTAEVFTTAFRRIGDIPESPLDRLWLYGVAHRLLSRHHRSTDRRTRLERRLAGQRPEEPDGDPAGGRAAAAAAAVEQLGPTDREVVRLVLWEGLSHGEAAEVLGITANAVGVRLHRARARLRKRLAAGEAPMALLPPIRPNEAG